MFIVENLENGIKRCFDTPLRVAAFFLGREVSKYRILVCRALLEINTIPSNVSDIEFILENFNTLNMTDRSEPHYDLDDMIEIENEINRLADLLESLGL